MGGGERGRERADLFVAVLFGMPPVHCPDAKSCYCKMFGVCDTVCTIDHCDGLYEQPLFSQQPVGWRQLPKYDDV